MLKNDKCEHCGRQLTNIEEQFCDQCIQESLHKLSEKGLVDIKNTKRGEGYKITKHGLKVLEEERRK